MAAIAPIRAPNLSRHAVRSAIEGCLARLKTDIDVWYIHGPDPLTSIEIIGPKLVAQLRELAGAVDLGLRADELATLDRLSALPVGYPHRVIDAFFDRDMTG